MAMVNKKTFKDLFSPSRVKMEEAFNNIYKEYSYLVFYISFKIVKQYDIAENITNETFMKFYLNKDKIKKVDSIKYYLVNTSKNLSINYYNSQKKICSLNEEITFTKKEENQYQEYLEKFKDFLNEEEMELIVYHLLYGFTFKEIAKMKNVSINTLFSKYKMALNKVRKHYKEEMF